MTHEELVEKVKDAIGLVLEEEGRDAARAAIAVIYEALRWTTPEMRTATEHTQETAHGIWSAMLAASPLNGGRNAGDN